MINALATELDSYRNKFIFVILHRSDTGLFKNELDKNYLITVQDGINNVMIQSIANFLSHYCL